MKNKVLITFGFCLIVTVLNMSAQVRPSHENLKHQWDFEAGNANDRVGEADGFLHNDASISGGILNLQSAEAQGGYVELQADLIQINTYPEIALEMWATADEVPLNNPNMLVFFGTTQGTLGYDYLFYTPGRRFDGDPGTRVGVSVGTWNAEDGIDYVSLDDSELHHHVVTWKDSLVVLYVDADSVGSATLDSADTENWYYIASTLSNDSAFIGKGGYTSDPTWKGTVELVALWDKALSPDEIQWLYDEGAKREPIVDAIDPGNELQSLKIYSADHRLFIKNVPCDAENLSVTVYTITGSMLFRTNNFRNGTHLDLNDGIYVVKVANHTISRVQKVLIR